MKTSNRRTFVKSSVVAAAAVLLAGSTMAGSLVGEPTLAPVKFEIAKLTYQYADMEPAIDQTTMQIHYEKHYSAYVNNANEAIAAEKVQETDAKKLLANISKYSSKLRNNAGGAYNHELFWSLLRKPTQNNAPTGELLTAINKSFGSFEKFQEEFAKAAAGQFGSGWAWLVKDGNQLKIGSTANQDNPLMDVSKFKGTPILALDVWEHAYYLHYQNKRADYIKNFWSVVNWDQVAKLYKN